MRCARCGGDIPEGSPSCPGCGLKVKMRVPGEETPSEGMQVPPATGPPTVPPPVAAPLSQELPPGATRITEPSAPGEWPPKVTVGPPPQPIQAKRKVPIAVIAIILIGLLLIGGAAAAYFLVFREKSTSEPEATVEGFLTAMYAGDVEKAESYATADAQALIAESASLISKLGVKFELKDVELKTLDESGDSASVEIVNISLHASSGEFSSDIDMKQMKSMMGLDRIIYKLVKQDGKWLISGVQTS